MVVHPGQVRPSHYAPVQDSGRTTGLYFGAELAADDSRVLARTPLHGPNLFPAEPEGFREVGLAEPAAAPKEFGDMLVLIN
jgi:hypothetical protein